MGVEGGLADPAFYGCEPQPFTGSGRLLPNSADVLDDTLDEIMPGGPVTTAAIFGPPKDQSGAPVHARHREAAVHDPYLSPAKSEAVRALLVLIEFAQAHTYSTAHTPDNELDLRGFCVDAKLTERQVEVALMIGEGWGIGAIAERLEITRQAVSMHLTRARVKLIRQALPVDAILPKRLQDAYDCSGQLTLGAG